MGLGARASGIRYKNCYHPITLSHPLSHPLPAQRMRGRTGLAGPENQSRARAQCSVTGPGTRRWHPEPRPPSQAGSPIPCLIPCLIPCRDTELCSTGTRPDPANPARPCACPNPAPGTCTRSRGRPRSRDAQG